MVFAKKGTKKKLSHPSDVLSNDVIRSCVGCTGLTGRYATRLSVEVATPAGWSIPSSICTVGISNEGLFPLAHFGRYCYNFSAQKLNIYNIVSKLHQSISLLTNTSIQKSFCLFVAYNGLALGLFKSLQCTHTQ